jgi:hypothetical protein
MQTIRVLSVAVTLVAAGALAAQPINPKVFKVEFDKVSKDAEVVAKVRVLAAACTATAGEGKQKSATLQLSLQILESEKGPAKKNDVIVVKHEVPLPSGPGPGSYGYMSALRKFPITPGVQGSVALRWDKEARAYQVMAGWVETPNDAAIPKEVGKAFVAGDSAAK